MLLLLRALPMTGLLGSWNALGPRSSNWVQRPCTGISCSLATSGADIENKCPEAILRDLLEFFQGEFDNYDQVIDDHEAGMAAGPGGGHEHIHCSLKPLDPSLVPEQVAAGGAASWRGNGSGVEEGAGAGGLDQPLAVVAAKYYFNGDSNVVFRYRLYSFHLCPPDAPGARGDVVMRLWRLLPPVESRLRAAGYDLTSFDWCDSRQPQDTPGREKADANGLFAAGGGGALKPYGDVAEHILGCEIYWSRHADTGKEAAHEGEGHTSVGVDGASSGSSSDDTAVGAASSPSLTAASPPGGASFVGVMGKDDSGTWVQSQNVAGLEILVKDDLRVWADRLWVNDRGFDRQGNFVYGNQRSVPYKMRRVVAPGPLAWTLGEPHRTKAAYAEKMSAIGVVTGQRTGSPVRRPAAE